jgi:hypothetical protein
VTAYVYWCDVTPVGLVSAMRTGDRYSGRVSLSSVRPAVAVTCEPPGRLRGEMTDDRELAGLDPFGLLDAEAGCLDAFFSGLHALRLCGPVPDCIR